MKIGLITMSCSYNYGAVLQTFGLYEYLKQLGHEVYVINYIPIRYDIDNRDNCEQWLNNSTLWNSSILKRFIFKKWIFPGIIKTSLPFRRFVRDYVNLTSECRNENELTENCSDMDIYITGSDQVWNSDFLWDIEKSKAIIDLPYYLSFAPKDKKKISYAASFGKKHLSDEEEKIVSRYLSLYRCISVREESGKEIINKMGLDCSVVADPTILCNEGIWIKLARDSTKKDEYILAYGIDFNKHFIKVASAISKILGIRIKYICMSRNSKLKHPFSRGLIVLPEVTEWLKYFKNARFVVTDSFHGTVFSTVFKKEFISILSTNSGRFSGRIHDYLSTLGLLNRTIDYDTDFMTLKDKVSNKINYSLVDEKRHNYQEMSRSWLENSIRKC